MFGKIKQLAGESLIYGVANIVSRFLSIFLVPIYTRIFLPHDYGVIALVNSTYNLLAVLMILGFDSAMMLYYHDFKDDDQKKPISIRFWTQLIITVLTCLILLPVSKLFSGFITKEDGHSVIFLYSTLNLLFYILPYTLIGWFRLKRNAMGTVVFTIGSSALTICLNIVFVVVLKTGLNGIFLSTLLSSVIQTMVAFFYLKDWILLKYFDRAILKKMFLFAFPLIPTSIAQWITTSSASYFLNHFLDKSEVGLYQIASSLASVMFMITGSFQMAYGPFAYSIKDQPDAKEIFAKIFVIYAAVTCLLTVGISAFSKLALQIVTTSAYMPAFITASILAFNFTITGYLYIASLGPSLAKTNWPLAKSIVASGIITVILFLILIPPLKIEGAALALTLGQIIVPVYCFIVSQKLYYIPYNFRKVILLTIITLAISAFALYLNYQYDKLIFANILIFFTFCLILYLFYRKTLLYVSKKILRM